MSERRSDAMTAQWSLPPDLAFSNTSLSMNPLKVVDSGSSECCIIAGCVGSRQVRMHCLGSVVGSVCCSLGFWHDTDAGGRELNN